MFNAKDVRTLNELELYVYDYVSHHLEECKTLTIRKLSDQCHVSSTTILRFLKKMGFEGYSEFKYALRRENNNDVDLNSPMGKMQPFIKKVSTDAFEQKIQRVATLINDSDKCYIIGFDDCANVARYGAQILRESDYDAQVLTDDQIDKQVINEANENMMALCVCDSGENLTVLAYVDSLRKKGVKIVAITKNHMSHLAKSADFNLSYDFGLMRKYPDEFITQVPAVYLVEQLLKDAKNQQQNEVVEQEQQA